MKPCAIFGLSACAIGAGVIFNGLHIARARENLESQGRAITECKDLLPENKQYTMNIDLYIDTRDGAESTLDLVLLDDATPESLDIPDGTEPFLNCVLQTLGLPDEQI